MEKDLTLTQEIERANSYRVMMQSWSWKDFETNILNVQRQEALEKILNTGVNVEKIRGVVECIDQIKSSLNYILEGYN